MMSRLGVAAVEHRQKHGQTVEIERRALIQLSLKRQERLRLWIQARHQTLCGEHRARGRPPNRRRRHGVAHGAQTRDDLRALPERHQRIAHALVHRGQYRACDLSRVLIARRERGGGERHQSPRDGFSRLERVGSKRAQRKRKRPRRIVPVRHALVLAISETHLGHRRGEMDRISRRGGRRASRVRRRSLSNSRRHERGRRFRIQDVADVVIFVFMSSHRDGGSNEVCDGFSPQIRERAKRAPTRTRVDVEHERVRETVGFAHRRPVSRGDSHERADALRAPRATRSRRVRAIGVLHPPQRSQRA